MTGYDKVRKGYKWEVLALLWVAYLPVSYTHLRAHET